MTTNTAPSTLAAAATELNTLDVANDYLAARRTAAALAVIGHAAAQAGAVRVSFECIPDDRDYSLHTAGGETLDLDDLPEGVEDALNVGLDNIDDRRPSLLRPHVLDLDLDRTTGGAKSVTARVATLIAAPGRLTETMPEIAEVETHEALGRLVHWARHKAAHRS